MMENLRYPAATVLALALTWGPAGSFAQTLSDPMRPPAFAAPAGTAEGEPSAGALVLQSTLMSEGRRIAMIGGKPVKVGDRIGEARIVAIEPTSVTLREGASDRVLELYQGVDITRPKAQEPNDARKGKGKGKAKAARSAGGSKKGTE